MQYQSETASKLFSRCRDADSYIPFEKKLFSHFTSQDVVEISGEAGSGKTELLYHFIACCIFPSSWKNIQFGGLETEVIFIDNDCHFDLFRFVSILEHRVKSHINKLNVTINKKEIFSFIQNILKLLHVIKCFDCDEFILALSSLENSLCLQSRRNMVMIDGISSFYWSDRARFQNNYTKLTSHYKIIIDLVIKISKHCRTPVITSRRKFLSLSDTDKKVFGQLWKNAVTWKFELKYETSLPDQTLLKLFNVLNSTTKLCAVKNCGFLILDEK